MLKRGSILLIRLMMVAITLWEAVHWLQWPARLRAEQTLWVDGQGMVATDFSLRARGENLWTPEEGYGPRDIAVVIAADGARHELRCRDAEALCDRLTRYVSTPVQVRLWPLPGRSYGWLAEARQGTRPIGDLQAQAERYLAMRRERLWLIAGLLALTGAMFLRPGWLSPSRD